MALRTFDLRKPQDKFDFLSIQGTRKIHDINGLQIKLKTARPSDPWASPFWEENTDDLEQKFLFRIDVVPPTKKVVIDQKALPMVVHFRLKSHPDTVYLLTTITPSTYASACSALISRTNVKEAERWEWTNLVPYYSGPWMEFVLEVPA